MLQSEAIGERWKVSTLQNTNMPYITNLENKIHQLCMCTHNSVQVVLQHVQLQYHETQLTLQYLVSFTELKCDI